MTKTIAICNQKGGVGKTTTTLNLGVGLARQGKRVLLVDADPQSDLTSSLGWNGDTLEKSLGRLMYLATQEYKPVVQDSIIHHPEGIDLIPSNLDLSSMETQLVNAMSREKILSNLLRDVKKDYDYILMSRGITLTEEQGEKLIKSLGQRMLDKQKARAEIDPYER